MYLRDREKSVELTACLCATGESPGGRHHLLLHMSTRPCFLFGAQFKRKEDLHFLTLIKNSTYFEPPPISTNLLVKQKGLCRHTEAWDRDVSCCKAQSLFRQSREACAQRMQPGNGHQKPRFKPFGWQHAHSQS